MIFELISIDSSSWWLSTLSGNVLACPVNSSDEAVHPSNTSMAYSIDFASLESKTTKGLFNDIDEYLVPLLDTNLPKRVTKKERDMLVALSNSADRISIEAVRKKLTSNQ